MATVNLPNTSKSTSDDNLFSDVYANDSALQDEINGSLDDDNYSAGGMSLSKLTAAAQAVLGVDGTAVRRGVLITAGEETTTSATFTTLSTPDQIASVVLPSNGLIFVAFSALWKASATPTNSEAAIFIGSNQLTVRRVGVTAPVTQGAVIEDSSTAAKYAEISSCPQGLVSHYTDGTVTGAITTGQALAIATSEGSSTGASMKLGGTHLNVEPGGGPCAVQAAAGTYTISVQFKHTASATLSVKERKLWVWTMGF